MGADGVPISQRIFGNGYLDLDGDGVNEGDGQQYYLRPCLIEFMSSRTILIEGVTLKSSPFWTTHFVQSENIIVRRNYVYENVAGIEIENSKFADVYENETTANTAGILVFDLPSPPVTFSPNPT